MTVLTWIKLGLKHGYKRTPEDPRPSDRVPDEPPIIKQKLKGPHDVPPGQWPSEGQHIDFILKKNLFCDCN